MRRGAGYRYILTAYAVGIVVFTLFRLLNTWVYCHNAATVPDFEGQYFQALVMGWRFDTVVSCYLLTLPLLMMIVGELAHIRARGYYRTAHIILMTLYIVAFFACTVDVPFFSYFFTRLNAVAANEIDSFGLIADMILSEPVYLLGLLAFVLLAVGYAFLMRWIFRRLFYEIENKHTPVFDHPSKEGTNAAANSQFSTLRKVSEEGKSQDLHYSEPKQCLEEILNSQFNEHTPVFDHPSKEGMAGAVNLSVTGDTPAFTFLASAKDPVKDQTDFLSQLSYAQISKLMFPIGGMMKSEVRDIAHAAHLPSADRKDSQGICFLGKINYNDFLRRYLGEREGKIVELETGKILGTHRGYWFHTIGQRKGLFLSGGPWFVVKKDIEENVLYVSQGYDPDAQYGNRVDLLDFHYLSYDLWSEQLEAGIPVDVKFKIRHTPEFAQGHLIRTEQGVSILSDVRIQGIAPGQYATIYDNDAHLVVATGQIKN